MSLRPHYEVECPRLTLFRSTSNLFSDESLRQLNGAIERCRQRHQRQHGWGSGYGNARVEPLREQPGHDPSYRLAMPVLTNR